MSEHLSDSNTLKSRKTYGKEKDYKNLSISSENGEMNTKELCGEEISESVTSVSSYSENTNVQKDSNVNSKFCLFNDEDTDYSFSVSTEVQKDPHSIPEAPCSSSHYQCTRKNLKSRLSNQHGSFEEMSELRSQEENSDSPNEFKSVSNLLNLAQVPSTAENSHVSVDNKVEHTRSGIKSTDAYVNKLPQEPIVFQMANQAGETSGKGTWLQNSSNMFSLVDLVNRYSASNKQALSKSNSAIKQKRMQGRCESVSTKKIVVKHDVSSKVNFDKMKTFNSTNSVRNKSISDIGKRDVKSPSKAAKKVNDKYIKGTERSIQMLQKFVSKNKPVKYSKTKGKCPSTSYLQMVTNETTEKILSDNDDKQIEKTLFLQSQECMNKKQVLNDIPEKDVASNFALHMPYTVPSINNSIQGDNQALLCKNFNALSIPGPSSSNNRSSLNAEDFNVKEIATTTTTNITENNSQKSVSGPQTLLNSSIEFEQFVDKTFKDSKDNCILKCKEEATETFLMHPSLLNLPVKTFCESTEVRNVYLGYIDRLEMDTVNNLNLNKGYDFPENFENESLMRVIKDFMHTVVLYLIPADAKTPKTLTYSQIVKAAMLKMSTREFTTLMQMFKNPEPIYQLKDVMSRLTMVAMFVIFHEYEKKVKKR